MSCLTLCLDRWQGVCCTTLGWLARRPAHEDRRASRLPAEGDDGCTLIPT
jgi:hypothetical protein